MTASNDTVNQMVSYLKSLSTNNDEPYDDYILDRLVKHFIGPETYEQKINRVAKKLSKKFNKMGEDIFCDKINDFLNVIRKENEEDKKELDQIENSIVNMQSEHNNNIKYQQLNDDINKLYQELDLELNYQLHDYFRIEKLLTDSRRMISQLSSANIISHFQKLESYVNLYSTIIEEADESDLQLSKEYTMVKERSLSIISLSNSTK